MFQLSYSSKWWCQFAGALQVNPIQSAFWHDWQQLFGDFCKVTRVWSSRWRSWKNKPMSVESDWKTGLLEYIGKVKGTKTQFWKKVLKSLISTTYLHNLNDAEDKSGRTTFIGACHKGHNDVVKWRNFGILRQFFCFFVHCAIRPQECNYKFRRQNVVSPFECELLCNCYESANVVLYCIKVNVILTKCWS